MFNHRKYQLLNYLYIIHVTIPAVLVCIAILGMQMIVAAYIVNYTLICDFAQ